jgi:hypothetical protein
MGGIELVLLCREGRPREGSQTKNVVKRKSHDSCRDYREEMRLLGLRRRLARKDLSDEERQAIIEEIRRPESTMEMD